MADGVNVKMGVSGIAQFKQNMQTAKTSLKTVDEQLKLNEKQFRATGDAEQYMQQKSELLRQKLDEQRTVVENAEKALEQMASHGVDKTSKAFQTMQQQLLRARGDLLDTQAEMQGVESASDNASAAISDMNSELSSIGTQVSFQTVTDGLDKITSGLKNAAKRAIQMGEELVRATLGAGEWADELATTAKVYSGIDPTMTPEKLQRMRKTAELVDTNVETIINSKQKLASAMGKSDIDQVFAEFGIQNTRYGEIEDLDELFWKTGEALMKIDNEAKRAQMGKKLFGDWTSLIPLFETGREEYEKMMESQSVVSQESIDNLTKMDDQYKILQGEIETLKMTFLGELAPATTTVMETLTGLVQKFNDYLATDEGKEKMKALGDNIEKLFSSITDFDPDDAIQKIGDVMDGIESGFQWIADNWESVKTGLMAIAGGWAAIKLATIGLNIAQLVSGLMGLGAGAAGSAAAGAAGSAAGQAGAAAARNTINTAVQGGAAGAAGGFFVGAKNLVSGVAAKGASGITGAGMLFPVLGDRLLNETNAGRAVRDSQGVAAVWEGVQQDAIEKGEEILKNAQTFGDDWGRVFSNVNDLIDEWFGPKGSGSGGASRSFDTEAEDRAAADRERMTRELIRGTNENFNAAMNQQSTELQDAFVEYVQTQAAIQDYMASGQYDEKEINALLDKAEAAQAALMELEGHQEILNAYSDWRQRNSLGNEDWLLPDSKVMEEEWHITGENLPVALANGIDAQASVAENAAIRLANLITNTLTGSFKIASPSKVMMRLGEYVSEGFAEGIENGYDHVNSAVDKMAEVATSVTGRGGGAQPGRMIDVTLMIGPGRLTEVLVPLVDSTMGEEINLMRR